MTQEEKELLLIDLCARLPYGVKCYEAEVEYAFDIIGTTSNNKEFVFSDGYERNLEQIKPYLRPLSSMTEEEKKEYERFSHFSIGLAPILMDWVYSHHLDCCGLIEKGLALEAPKGMYNTK